MNLLLLEKFWISWKAINKWLQCIFPTRFSFTSVLQSIKSFLNSCTYFFGFFTVWCKVLVLALEPQLLFLWAGAGGENRISWPGGFKICKPVSKSQPQPRGGRERSHSALSCQGSRDTALRTLYPREMKLKDTSPGYWGSTAKQLQGQCRMVKSCIYQHLSTSLPLLGSGGSRSSVHKLLNTSVKTWFKWALGHSWTWLPGPRNHLPGHHGS